LIFEELCGIHAKLACIVPEAQSDLVESISPVTTLAS
jgi:hypothetical protein